MLVYEYKVAGTHKQYVAIDEAVRITQFIRNKCLRKWMDERSCDFIDILAPALTHIVAVALGQKWLYIEELISFL